MNGNEILYNSAAEIACINFDVIVSQKGILKIRINNAFSEEELAGVTKLRTDDPYLFGIFNQLREYFNAERKEFTVPIDLRGTGFQMRVWKELMKIPYGKTVSYKEIAARLGDAGAVRAVGHANGANPIPVIVPCHRVINTGGKLGGYSGGLTVKEKLLELEGARSLELFS